MTDWTQRMLLPELNQEQRMYLLSMAHHDGFPILKMMVEKAVEMAKEATFDVEPASPNYDAELKAAQQEARSIRRFAVALIMSFNAHTANAVTELERETAKEEKRRSPN